MFLGHYTNKISRDPSRVRFLKKVYGLLCRPVMHAKLCKNPETCMQKSCKNEYQKQLYNVALNASNCSGPECTHLGGRGQKKRFEIQLALIRPAYFLKPILPAGGLIGLLVRFSNL